MKEKKDGRQEVVSHMMEVESCSRQSRSGGEEPAGGRAVHPCGRPVGGAGRNQGAAAGHGQGGALREGGRGGRPCMS